MSTDLYRQLTEGLRRYAVEHLETGGFLRSVREVPLGEDALEVLARRARDAGDRPLFPFVFSTTYRREMVAACAAAKIALVTPNDMRRTFCSWLANGDVSEAQAARILGSSSTMVRRVYAQFAAETMARAVARLPQVTSERAQPRAQRRKR
jgi:integrase